MNVPVQPGKGIYPDGPEEDKAAFAKLNPNLAIPVLTDGDFTLYESMAINLCKHSAYSSCRIEIRRTDSQAADLTSVPRVDLAKKDGGSLAPANLEEDALFMQWTLWAMTSCETACLNLLFGSMQGNDDAIAEATQTLAKPLTALEASLTDKSYLVGDRFTCADLNVASVLQWALAGKYDFNQFPSVSKWLQSCVSRPSAKM